MLAELSACGSRSAQAHGSGKDFNMIQALRRHHRSSFFALTAVLVVTLIALLIPRRPMTQVERAAGRIHLITPSGTAMVTDPRSLWGGAVDHAEMLVYWAEDKPDLESLPMNARLLGSLDSGRRGVLRVPRGERSRGYLILYSPASEKPVAKAEVPREMP